MWYEVLGLFTKASVKIYLLLLLTKVSPSQGCQMSSLIIYVNRAACYLVAKVLGRDLESWWFKSQCNKIIPAVGLLSKALAPRGNWPVLSLFTFQCSWIKASAK